MRSVLLLPLALAAAAAACGTASDNDEQSAFRVPQRDLTLQRAGSSEVEIASPVELARPVVRRAPQHRARHLRRPAPVKRRPAVESASNPALATSAAEIKTRSDSSATTASAPSESPDPHALAPGQTVTVLPASSGPLSDPVSSDAEWTDQRRGGTIHIGGPGGGCDPRDRGGRPDGFRGFR